MQLQMEAVANELDFFEGARLRGEISRHQKILKSKLK